jgi:hypothetical protein
MPEPTGSTKQSKSFREREALQTDASGMSMSGPLVEAQNAGDIEPAAAERVAYASAKPVLASYCAPCHTTEGSRSTRAARKHFNMDTYPFGGHHSAAIGREIREVLGASGPKATMPKDDPGSVQGDELRLIVAWADAFDKAHPGAPGATHDHESGDDND